MYISILKEALRPFLLSTLEIDVTLRILGYMYLYIHRRGMIRSIIRFSPVFYCYVKYAAVGMYLSWDLVNIIVVSQTHTRVTKNIWVSMETVFYFFLLLELWKWWYLHVVEDLNSFNLLRKFNWNIIIWWKFENLSLKNMAYGSMAYQISEIIIKLDNSQNLILSEWWPNG